MKFRILKRWSARRFDGVIVPILRDTIIVPLDGDKHDAWVDIDTKKLVGCGIDVMLDIGLVEPLDSDARRVVTRFRRWKTARREYKRGRRKNTSYIMYGGCGYNLIKGI